MNKARSDSKINLYEMAVLKVFRLFLILNRLIDREKRKFDMLVGAGNSGSIFCTLANLYLQVKSDDFKSGLPIVLIPYSRNHPETKEPYKDDEKWTVLKSGIQSVEKQIGEQNPVSVLFMDDEIYEGTAFRESMQIYLDAFDGNSKLKNIVLVAEDHHNYYKNHKSQLIQNVQVEFHPYATRSDLDGAISHIVNDNGKYTEADFRKLKLKLCDELGAKKVVFQGGMLDMVAEGSPNEEFIEKMRDIIWECLDTEPPHELLVS